MEEELKLLGLNDVDIKVYLTLLKLGEGSAAEIASKAEIPRASVYDVLERLEQEGLVSYIIRDFKKYFSAADPKTIIETLEYKKKKIKDILPELEEIKKKTSTEATKTEVYEGKKGVQTVMNLMLEEKELFVMGASRKSFEVMPYFLEKWMRERIKRKIKVKIIYYDLREVRESLKGAKEYLGIGKGWDYRFLHTDYLSPIMTLVFGSNTALINWVKDNPSLILIKSQDIAETYKQYILRLWEISKK